MLFDLSVKNEKRVWNGVVIQGRIYFCFPVYCLTNIIIITTWVEGKLPNYLFNYLLLSYAQKIPYKATLALVRVIVL